MSGGTGAVKGGKATKRTRYGKTVRDRFSRTLRSADLCLQSGLAYHVLDAEWKWNYLMTDEAEELLSRSAGMTTVLTYSSRHINSLSIIRQTMERIGRRNGVAIGLVAGSPAFLSWREVRRPPVRSLRDAIVFARRFYPGIDLFIGAEGIGKHAVELALEYELIPFLLHDRSIEQELRSLRDHGVGGDIAVYIPYLISENYPRLLHDVLYRLAGYMLRRRWVQERLAALGYRVTAPSLREVIQEKGPLPPKLLESKLGAFLREAAERLAIYGTVDDVVKKIRELHGAGSTIMIGLPIKENEEQVKSFALCLSRVAGD